MNRELVKVARDGAIATVTLNRPEKLNALNRALRGEFCAAMLELNADGDVAVVIVTGAGRAFCAGLDLNELGAEGLRETGGVTFISVVERMDAPVIAAVNGFAVTGGFELALACDILIAAETAQFADTHARVGVMPGGGMSARLPRAVGLRKAKELSLTGRYLSARDAERLGLVNQVVPPDHLMTTARELALQIAGANQTIVRAMKQLYDRSVGTTLDEALRLEQAAFRDFNRRVNREELGAAHASVISHGRRQAAKS